MPITIGTGDGNKAISAIYVGTADGNKEITTAYLGTADGNETVFESNSWDGVVYSGANTLTRTAKQVASYDSSTSSTPANIEVSGNWTSVTLAGTTSLVRAASTYYEAYGDATLTATVRVYINGGSSAVATKTVTGTLKKSNLSGTAKVSTTGSLAGTFNLNGGSPIALSSIRVTHTLRLVSGVANAGISITATSKLTKVTLE